MIVEVVDVSREIRNREVFEDREGGRADAVRRNPVTRELIAHESPRTVRTGRRGIVDGNLVSLRVNKTTEVPSLECLSGDGNNRGALTDAGEEQAEAGEKERLVLFERPTQRESAFVLVVRRHVLLKVGLRIQLVRADVIEHAAAEPVGPGLDRDIAEPDAESAVFRVEAVRHHAEFADLLNRRPDFRERATLNELSGTSTVDEHFRIADAGAVRAGRECAATGEAWQILQEPGDIALRARDNDGELLHELFRECRRVGYGRRVEARRLNRHGFSDTGRLQDHVHADLDAGSNIDAFAKRRCKSGLRDHDLVGP